MVYKNYKTAILLIISFLVLRIIQLFSSFNRFYHPYELVISYLSHDAIINQLKPLFDYQTYPHVSGHLVVAVLNFPFFIALNGSIFSIKIIGILFWAVTLLLWYFFCKKYFSNTTAHIMGLSLIFSPPLLIYASLVTTGEHHEIALFVIAGIFVMYNALFLKKKYCLFLFGLLSGFAFNFNPIYIISFVSCLLYWILIDKRLFIKSILIVIVSFMIGAIQNLIYILDLSKKMTISGDSIPDLAFKGGLMGIFDKVKKITTDHLFHSFYFNDFYFIKSEIMSFIYYIIFTGSFVCLFWINRKHILNLFLNLHNKNNYFIPQQSRKEIFFVLFPIIYLLFYVTVDRQIGSSSLLNNPYRYLIILFPILIMLVSLALSKLRIMNKSLYIIVGGLFLTVGAIGNIEYLLPLSFNKHILTNQPTQYKAISYQVRGWNVSEKTLPHNIKAFLKETKTFNTDEEKFSFYMGVGSWISERFEGNTDLWITIINKMSAIDSNFKYYCYRGFIQDKEDNNFLYSIINYPDKWNEIIQKVEPKYRGFCYTALGISISTRHWDDRSKYFLNENAQLNKDIKLINQCPKTYKKYCYKGFSNGIGEIFWDEPRKYFKIKKYITHDYIPYYYEGLSVAINRSNGFDIKRTVNKIKKLISPAYHAFCFRSLLEEISITFVFDHVRRNELINELNLLTSGAKKFQQTPL